MYIIKSSKQTLNQCLQREYIINSNLIQKKYFYQGVQHVLYKKSIPKSWILYKDINKDNYNIDITSFLQFNGKKDIQFISENFNT